MCDCFVSAFACSGLDVFMSITSLAFVCCFVVFDGCLLVLVYTYLCLLACSCLLCAWLLCVFVFDRVYARVFKVCS